MNELSKPKKINDDGEIEIILIKEGKICSPRKYNIEQKVYS